MPKKPIHPPTKDEAEFIMGELANATHQRDKLMAKMNLKLTAIREEFEPSIASLTAIIDERVSVLHAFADANPQEFGKARSLKLVHGIIGYRLGNFAVKPIKGITWARVLNLIRDRLPGYIRIKEEVDKEAILADRDRLPATELQRIGLRIEQAESFYADPEKDEAPTQ